jgi:hypothetical protein
MTLENNFACDENNLFVYKDQATGEVYVVEVVVQESQEGRHLVQSSPDGSNIMLVPLASLVVFDEQCYHALVMILEEDAAASGYEAKERGLLRQFHQRARLALYTLATMGSDYTAGCRRIEEFLEERKDFHPDVFNDSRVLCFDTQLRCSRCHANPCYYDCTRHIEMLAFVWM